jgi:hypothetical protein
VTRQLPPQLDAYLTRIGATHPPQADPAALRELQLRHLLTVPFENLSIHLGEPILLDPQALVDKLVRRRRGGFCYELNGAFATLLAALGFRVTLLAARVFGAHGLGPPFDHLALRVDLDSSGSWLVDVGFGRHSHHPLRLDTRADQLDPGGTFRLADTADGDVDVIRDGQPQYRVRGPPSHPGRLRANLLVAPDLAPIPLHPRGRLLPTHPDRPGHPERPHPGPDDRRPAPGTHPDRRCRGPGRLPNLVRNHPGPRPRPAGGHPDSCSAAGFTGLNGADVSPAAQPGETR